MYCILATRGDMIIPDEYQLWNQVFQKPEQHLAEHQPWDHEILLEPGKTLTFGPIYKLIEYKLGVLKKYINNNLEVGYIRLLLLLAGYLILFIN